MPTVYLDYKLVHQYKKVEWKANIRYKGILYESKYQDSISSSIADLTNSLSCEFFIRDFGDRVSDCISYVIYKYYDKNEVIDKKKVVFQIGKSIIPDLKNHFRIIHPYTINCHDFVKKFNHKPQNDYELMSMIEKKENQFLEVKRLILDNDDIISKRRSWIKIYLDITELRKEEIEEMEEECIYDIGPDTTW